MGIRELYHNFSCHCRSYKEFYRIYYTAARSLNEYAEEYEKYLNNKIECIVKIMIVEMILRKWTE